jgi:hypothetical protein
VAVAAAFDPHDGGAQIVSAMLLGNAAQLPEAGL